MVEAVNDEIKRRGETIIRVKAGMKMKEVDWG